MEIAPGIEAWRNLLECGHLIRHAEDIFGERHPDRRRCRKCLRGDPREIE